MNKRGKNDVDAEVDLHGLTIAEMRLTLQKRWPEWRGMRQVRLIHGQGVALKPELTRWCEEMGIPFTLEANNPGSLRIFPRERALPDNALGNTLREKGLRLTPEQEAYLRDPQAMERARQEEQRRQAEEARKRQADAAVQQARRRQEEGLWQAEMARLERMDRSRGGAKSDAKPAAPIIVPPAQIKHQEGYWRAELVRVAETEESTLHKQKRTGLDKLAPPIPPPPPAEAQTPRRAAPPPRETEADKALFEAEMARLADPDARN